jgi:hypothetical protein
MPRQDKGIAAAFARARGRDLRLATWMTRNHDALLPELGTGRIEWGAPLRVFADLGLTDDGGKPEITRDTASRTWRRVRKAVAAARQVEAAARPAFGELVPGVRLVAPASAYMPVRTSCPPAPDAAALIAGTPAGAVEATEHIAAVLAGMGASRVPLPSQPSRQPQPAPMHPAPDQDSTP